jgi:hypothetical protein
VSLRKKYQKAPILLPGEAKKMAFCGPGSSPSPHSGSAGPLTLDFSVRSKFLLLIGYLVTVA